MKHIHLNGKYGSIIGNYALVDDEDFDELNKHKWFAQKVKNLFYVNRGIRLPKVSYKVYGKINIISMHRQILGITDSEIFIDHIDHNPLNNTKINLRICTQSENSRNRRSNKNSLSKYLGVSKMYRKLKNGDIKEYFVASVARNYIGVFKDEKLAAEKYNEKAKELFGEFANLNIIE